MSAALRVHLGDLTGDAPRELSIEREEVHVWRASSDLGAATVGRLARTLSPDERARADRFRLDRDRDRFIAGRGVLRALLARYLARPPAGIRLRYGARGKPALAAEPDGVEPDAPDVRFNLSHADGLVLYAVARGREIGVDVERVVPHLATARMVERCLTDREGALVRGLDPAEQPAAFFGCWTRKEAYLKGLGLGLALPPRHVEVSPGEDEPPRLLAGAALPADASGWSLRSLALGAGYRAALAVRAP
jgi:4'-phosphopantetheinyl transferase